MQTPIHNRIHRSQQQQPFATRTAVIALCIALTAWATPSIATDLTVKITGIQAPLGNVGCSLFADAAGFPMDNSKARAIWQPAQADGVTCRFSGLSGGRYAVSVGHDTNGNGRVDTNFVGMPTEQWGVSNNVRPSLRAPRFDETAFTVAADAKEVVLEIKVGK